MSRSYDHEKDYLEKIKPDYSDEFTSRDMRSVDDQGYTGETLEEEEDEQWANENKSPIAGKMSGSMEELERIQSPEVATRQEILECAKICLNCYQKCTETLPLCTKVGGKHVEPEHLNLLMDCARMCVTNADFMLRNSNYYQQSCTITARISDDCAESCEKFDEDFMKECANACRRCAESCREMNR